MPAFDQCHDQVVRALEKDGWTVEAAPSRIYLAFRFVYIDLRLSRGTNGSREEIIVVEVKCFPDPDNTTRDLYIAIGQYLIYRAMLADLELPYTVYLAVPDEIYRAIFDRVVMRVIAESRVKMVIVDLDAETVQQWIE